MFDGIGGGGGDVDGCVEGIDAKLTELFWVISDATDEADDGDMMSLSRLGNAADGFSEEALAVNLALARDDGVGIAQVLLKAN